MYIPPNSRADTAGRTVSSQAAVRTAVSAGQVGIAMDRRLEITMADWSDDAPEWNANASLCSIQGPDARFVGSYQVFREKDQAVGAFDCDDPDAGQAQVSVTDHPTSEATKITAANAIEIFKAKGPGTRRSGLSKVLADKYGITTKAIRDIWNLRTWSEVTRPLWSPEERARRVGSSAASRLTSFTQYRPESLMPASPAGTSYVPKQTFAPTQYCHEAFSVPMQTFAPTQDRPDDFSPAPPAGTSYLPMQTFAPTQYRPDDLVSAEHS